MIASIDFLAAAVAATRSAPAAIRRKRSAARRVFLQLARRQGWRNARQLARMCGMSVRSVFEQLEHEDIRALEAAALCLGDARLRAGLDADVRALLIEPREPRGSWPDDRVMSARTA